MQYNKSPYIDRLPVDFYQCFGDKISTLVHNMLNSQRVNFISQIRIRDTAYKLYTN